MPTGDWQNIAFAAFLFILSGGFLAWGFLRNRAAEPPADPDERKFYRRQYRRRTAANVLLALIGVAVLGGTQVVSNLAVLIYWSGVLLVVLAVLILVVLDMLSSGTHFRSLLQQQRRQREALEQDLAQWRREQENGQLPPDG